MPEARATDAAPVAVCAIVPVYNHPATIAAVVADLRRHDLSVILVDDGSEAACAAVLNGLAAADDAVSLLTQERNAGKGRAVLTGARVALARGFSHALQIDADGQHDSGAIPAALAQARCKPTALVMGAPIFRGAMPASRRYGRWLTHVLVWLETLAFTIRDALCGFRVYPLAELVALDNRRPLGARMDFEIDVAVRMVWDNVPVTRVAVVVRYPVDGISHFDYWSDNVLITHTHLRLVAGMVIRIPLLLCQRLCAVFSR